MRRFVIVIVFICSASISYSQEEYWNRANLFSFSGGIYSMMKLKVQAEVKDRNPIEYHIPFSFPPIHLKYEYFINRQTSIGAEFSYASARASFSRLKNDEYFMKDTVYNYKVSSSNPAVAAFISVHANNSKLSPFFSIGIQINFISDKFISTTDPHPGKEDYSSFDVSLPKTIYVQLGLRYMVNKHIGISVYASYFPSIIAAGVSYKIRKD